MANGYFKIKAPLVTIQQQNIQALILQSQIVYIAQILLTKCLFLTAVEDRTRKIYLKKVLWKTTLLL